MSRNRLKLLYFKFIIIIVCFFIILKLFNLTYAKYVTEVTANVGINFAFYILEEDFQSMTLNLDSIIPQNNCYTYTFLVKNEDENGKRSDLDINYTIIIRTTTNLPLTYELYKNEEYDDDDATSIFESNEVEQDEYGTYFRTMKTETVETRYSETTSNTYQLVVRFPETYDTEDYQGILEMIEISVDSKQVIDEDDSDNENNVTENVVENVTE